LLFTACSNDQFTEGDGSADVEAGGPAETSTQDVVEASAVEGGPTGFCATQSNAFYCDDFDTLAPVTASFSVWTTGSIAFGAGLTGQGLAISAVAITSPTVYVTKQVQGNALHEIDFAMQLGAPTLATYVRVTAGSSTFMVGVDVGANITIQGDASTNATLVKADTSWHSFAVRFESGKANVAVDSKAPVSVTFAAIAPTSSTTDLGVVVGTLGGKVSFDDVVLR
jgi:hypothetical protein